MICLLKIQKQIKARQDKKTSAKGFTLIELIMSVSVMAILFSVGYANFRDFQRRKDLERAVLRIESDLRLTQELALSGRKDACADPQILQGYQFVIDTGTSYRIQEVCSDDPPTTTDTKIEDSIFTSLDLTIAPVPTSILFKILGQGIFELSGSIVLTVTQTSTGNTRTITITDGGDISY